MKTRKLVLIIADIVLLAVVITQFVFLSKDGSKTFKLKETPDEIVIQNGDESVLLTFENNQWVVGNKKYETNMSTVDEILESIQSIKCIDKVGSLTKTGNAEKYELTDDKKITVTAKKDGNELRTINIGKSGSTGTQNFITVDGGNDIYLATGGLGYDFDITEDVIRSNIVWDFDESEISSVEVTKYNGKNGTESFSVSKTGSGEDLKWLLTGSLSKDMELDTEKAQSWFDTLGNLTTSVWYDESKNHGGTKVGTTRITHGGKVTTIDVYEIPDIKLVDSSDSEDDFNENPTYYGKCNETPYPFELTLYTMERINKDLEELVK